MLVPDSFRNPASPMTALACVDPVPETALEIVAAT
jgi:hypothetical protein